MKRVQTVAPKQMLAVARRMQSVSMHTPIGQGRVVPLQFDYARPAYVVPSYGKFFFIHFMWSQQNHMPNLLLCFCICFAIHGGFTGHLPPDPHDLWG